ncbi:helix-turn-helix transcriptional regulator [Deinococcus marmoris]|uniref:HTH cro/C1-type domain-containing protein n=1 Tax=Deinococcus marmoris TaxID=249408 RepID=A0A1U7NW40_9DEIO|nr:helix-turn-helix transcriptional regulator [Deinococcus marmoris]OLV17148.1 hypothetical protein BOO71_0009745 [Deinococcus marmoris]
MKEQKTLNQWRKERGLTVDELAEKAGVGRSIHSWLYSGNIPGLKTGLILAEALGVDVTQIVWGKEERREVEVSPMPEGREVTGNQSRVTREQYEVAKQWVAAGRDMTVTADAIGVSRGTLYKAFARFEKEDGLQKSSEGPAHEAAGSKVKTRKPEASEAAS